MNIANKAIIMAAGMGKRLRPVTYDIPKPLIKVNGNRMIDSIIDSLNYNGISEIYVVVGYLKKQYIQLTEKYDNVKLIENPYYSTSNNISSLYVAKDFLGDCIIVDGDQIIENKSIVNPCFERSGYCVIKMHEYTKEWILNVNDRGIVEGCSRTGGNNGWQLVGVSFWSKRDGELLRQCLIEEFEVRKNLDIYWDDLALFCYPELFELGIREINISDLIEIDEYKELVSYDNSYLNYRREE